MSEARPNVAIVTPSVFPSTYPTDGYGFESYCAMLADAMHELFEVTLVAPKGSKCKKANVLETIDPPSTWGDEEERAFKEYTGKLGDIDVILDFSHKHLPYRFTNKRVIGVLAGVQTEITRYRNSLCLVSLSQWHFKDTFSRFGFASRVIPLNIPLDDYRVRGQKSDYVLVYGAKLEHKGSLDLVEAWPKESPTKLVIAGEDVFGCSQDYVNRLKEACNAKGILYVGTTTGSAKLELMKGARAALLPFRRPEAWSIVALEALAVGTPVVATHSDGVPRTNTMLASDMTELAQLEGPLSDAYEVRKFAEINHPFGRSLAMFEQAIDQVLKGRFW